MAISGVDIWLSVKRCMVVSPQRRHMVISEACLYPSLTGDSSSKSLGAATISQMEFSNPK